MAVSNITFNPTVISGGRWSSSAQGDPATITYADRTKTVAADASGSGDGTDGNPWTLAQAMANAVAGDIVGVKAGLYIGSQTAPDDGAKRYSPAFKPANSGTQASPIYFVAENFASLTAVNRSEIRSGATVSGDGWPAFGTLTKNWIYWYGFYSDESAADNKPRNDAAPATFWTCTGGGIRYCDIRGIDVAWTDNHSGVRLENTSQFEVSDNYIYNFRVNGGGSTNQAGVLTYGCHTCEIKYNEIDYCGNNVFWKAGTPQYGMKAHHNYFKRGTDAFRIQLLTDTARNEIYQNIFGDYGTSAIFFSQTASPQPMPQNLVIANNIFIGRTTSGGNLGTFRYDHSAYTSTTNFIRNNIIQNTNSSSVITSDFLTDAAIVAGFTDHDYNCYYQYGASFGGSNGGAGTLRSLTVGDWETTYGMDANAVFANPLFVSASDFTLQGGSPCIDAGVDILQLLGGTNTAPINMGVYVNGVETIGVRPLS